MALLASHLEQMSLSAQAISELEFPARGIFTNALLKDHEITTLIRDTEPHERALFSLDPNAVRRTQQDSGIRSAGSDVIPHARQSMFPGGQHAKQSVITRLLGNEMLQEIRKSSSNGVRARDGVNVEVLLQGAEKLCEVYTVAGASERIRALRNHYREVSSSLSALESKVSKQQTSLDRQNQGFDESHAEWDDMRHENTSRNGDMTEFTDQDFQLEEDEIKELEARKRALEERVAGMEKDLGGLLR
ncbi:hypothetical protein ABEF95_002481 [Exophiala dermatitidis]